MFRPLVVVLSLVALLAAGCGGDGGGDGGGTSEQEYGRQLSRVTAGVQRAVGELARTTGRGDSPKAAGERLSRGASVLDQAADDFARITPPPASRAAHRRLVDGLRRLADVFRSGVDAARRDDRAALARALQGLATSRGAQEITSAVQELQRQGVKVTAAAS